MAMGKDCVPVFFGLLKLSIVFLVLEEKINVIYSVFVISQV